ncbi:MAG TPA: hypothetical protein VN364_07200 [Bellilinea sp.]|nr:hypothetical protein [Bellilinea sp.]
MINEYKRPGSADPDPGFECSDYSIISHHLYCSAKYLAANPLHRVCSNPTGAVINAVRAIVEGKFSGGIHVGTLANGGVSLAPFHQLDHLVSAQVKADLEEIKAGIISGEIKTLP